MYYQIVVRIVVTFISLPVHTSALRWLSLASLSSSLTTASQDFCDNMPGLERRQRKVCRRHMDVMGSVTRGANMSISECQHQFKDRRWNCSMVDSDNIFGNLINQGTREAAYVHAIAAAGVSHAVTESCSQGQLSGCGCDRSLKGETPNGFEWAGCSDNIAFGSAFSKRFTDARERIKKTNGKSLMNLHNNNAGRKIVEEMMKTECKCHGVSGSCELRTCWRALPTFREVGRTLREAFDGATEIKAISTKTANRLTLQPANRKFKPYTSTDLVYLKSSPDFCEADGRFCSFGTQGRICNKTSKALDGCDLMCCGRGYHTVVRTVVERCDCKFHWCCFVQCKECEKTIEENICL